jgi:hypothetical protein
MFLFPLYVNTGVFIVTVLCNIILPMTEKFKFTFLSIPQLVLIGMYVYSILSSWGLLGLNRWFIPLLQVVLVRGLEAWGFCYMLKDLTFTSLLVLCGFDLLFIIVTFYCKYKYVFCLMKTDINGNLIEIAEEEDW